jgi:lipopolysaccharide transport system permease protein
LQNTELTPERLHTRIQPSHGWVKLQLGELWSYRSLIYFFAWRNIKVRYKQTVLGAGWAVIQPVVTMVVFTLFFGRLAGIPSDGVPYPIFNYAALVPWSFFTAVVTGTANSVTGSAGMIKKIYFPRLAVPASNVFSSGLDFTLAFAVLILMIIGFGLRPTLNILWLPLLMLIGIATALGVGLWLAALNAQFRDVRYAIPFIVQIWFFSTPIVYPSSMLSENLQAIYAINPMAGVVEGFRWALLGLDTQPGPMILVSGLMSVVLLITGLFFFKRMERVFADVM